MLNINKKKLKNVWMQDIAFICLRHARKMLILCLVSNLSSLFKLTI